MFRAHLVDDGGGEIDAELGFVAEVGGEFVGEGLFFFKKKEKKGWG